MPDDLKEKHAYIIHKDTSSGEILKSLCEECSLSVVVSVNSFSEILKDLALRAAENKRLSGIIIIGPDSFDLEEYKILVSTLNRFVFYQGLKCIAIIPRNNTALATQLKDTRLNGVLTMPTTKDQFESMVNKVMSNGHHSEIVTPGVHHSNGHKIKILMADNSIMNQELIKIYFKYLGFDADFATTGEQVLEMIENESYDICFLDTEVEGLDGIRTTQCIRQEKGSDIPVVALLHTHSQDLISECQSAGVNGFLFKPVDMIRLNEKIKAFVSLEN